MKDYYKILHVAIEASPEEIEEAYIRLNEEYKPEEHYPEDSYHVRIYKDIQEAYAVLSDPQKREAFTNVLLEGRGEIENIEDREREEGFGDVLKLLLADPKATKRAKPEPKRLTSGANRSTGGFRKAILATLLLLILILSGFIVYYFLEDNTFDEVAEKEIPAEIVKAEEEDEKSVIEEDLTKIVEEEAASEVIEEVAAEEELPEVTEEEASSPYELDEEADLEMANFTLDECLNLISSESVTFERKENAIARALQFFNSTNSNVVVVGSNNVQIRRETIEDYLFILMLQGYDIRIINSEKNGAGKITQLTVKENS